MGHGRYHGKGQCGADDVHHGGFHGGRGHGCCGGRAFLTKEEKLEKLGEYRDWLLNEAKGVEEAMEELKKD